MYIYTKNPVLAIATCVGVQCIQFIVANQGTPVEQTWKIEGLGAKKSPLFGLDQKQKKTQTIWSNSCISLACKVVKETDFFSHMLMSHIPCLTHPDPTPPEDFPLKADSPAARLNGSHREESLVKIG